MLNTKQEIDIMQLLVHQLIGKQEKNIQYILSIYKFGEKHNINTKFQDISRSTLQKFHIPPKQLFLKQQCTN